jgi:hypothetical protein
MAHVAAFHYLGAESITRSIFNIERVQLETNRRIEMVLTCAKCKATPEYHKGSVTGGSTGKYLRLRQEINESGTLTLKRRLCIKCMEELLLWMKNRKAHVLVLFSPRPTSTTKIATWMKKTA